MSPVFERRIREHRARMLVRLLDSRQRRHARGAWLRELEPPKLMVTASSARIARIASAQPVPMRLGGELLAATCLALTPFEASA